MQWILIIKY